MFFRSRSYKFSPGDSVKLSYNLEGIESACQVASLTILNSCGIHIHSGFSCDAAQGHYFDSSTFPSDPWVPAVYEANSTQSPVIVSYGYGMTASQVPLRKQCVTKLCHLHTFELFDS